MGLKINGSTSGSIEIDVPAVAGTDTSITIPATSGGQFIVSDSAGDVNIDSGTLFVDSSADRVGIGLTSPSTKLHVQVGSDEAIRASATGANQGIWSRYIAGSPHDVDFYVGSDGASGGLTGVGGAVVWNAGNTPLGFGTNDTERMRIADDGAILINRTSQISGLPGRLVSEGNGASSSTLCPLVLSDTLAGASGGSNTARIIRDGTQVGTISTTSSATSYNTSSDYRLKENVVDLDGAITRVKQLAPKRFNFIVDADRTVDGFLAHEAQVVVPEAVTGTHNEVDDDGNPVYQGIDQAKLVPLLTAALQEAIGKIEALETANASLEARLTALEGGAS